MSKGPAMERGNGVMDIASKDRRDLEASCNGLKSCHVCSSTAPETPHSL